MSVEGTRLPNVLKPSRLMTSLDLNTKISDFLTQNGRKMDKAQWAASYPMASE